MLKEINYSPSRQTRELKRGRSITMIITVSTLRGALIDNTNVLRSSSRGSPIESDLPSLM